MIAQTFSFTCVRFWKRKTFAINTFASVNYRSRGNVLKEKKTKTSVNEKKTCSVYENDTENFSTYKNINVRKCGNIFSIEQYIYIHIHIYIYIYSARIKLW